MLLTVDLGNTSLTLGVYENEEKKCFLVTEAKQDDYGPIIKNFLYKNNLKEEFIDDSIVSCVVPDKGKMIVETIKQLFHKEPYIFGPDNCPALKIDIPNPSEVGSDLLAMCTYAYHIYGQELLVVSLGTATVISHVTYDGKFKHCAIAPGYSKVAESLWGNAAKLPEFEQQATNTFLANNTIDAMNVGIYHGFVGSLRYLLAGIKGELNVSPIIVGCGGFGKDFVANIKEITYYDPDMVSAGLAFVYYRFYK